MRLRPLRRHINRSRIFAGLSSITAVGVLEGCRGSGKSVALRDWLETIPHSVLIEDAGAPGAWNTLLNAISSHPETRVAAIDRFERAPVGMSEAVLSLVARNPGLRLIVAGRSVGALGNRLVRVQNDIVRLGPGDLALDDDEVEELLGLRPAATELEILRLPLVCVAAAALIAEEGMRLAPATLAAASEVLRDALGGIDPLVVEAIRLMAVPESISENAPLPGFSPSDHRALLAELAQRGLGVSLEGEFRFAPSWRGVLSEEFRSSSPAAFRLAHAKAAAELDDAEHAIDALRHWIDAVQFERAAATAREFWGEFVALRPEQTLGVLERADRGLLGRTPTLCALIAECAAARGDHRRAESWWRAALAASAGTESSHLAHRAPDATERRWEVFVRTRAFRGLGLYEEAASTAEEGMRILRPARLLPPRTSVVGGMTAEFALALLHIGELDRARALLADAAALAPRGSAGWFVGSSLGAGLEALCGNMVGAERILDEIDRLLVEPRLAESVLGSWVSLGRAVLASDRGRAEEARRHLARARNRVTRDLEALVDVVEAFIEFTHGQADTALAIVSSVWPDPAAPPFVRGWAEWVRASCLVRLGRPPASAAETGGLPPSVVSVSVVRAGERMLAGDPASAFALLVPVLTQTPANTTERFLAVMQAMLVVAALDVGEVPVAQAALQQLRALRDTTGTTLPAAFITSSNIGFVTSALPGARDVLVGMVPPGATPAQAPPERPVLSAAQQRVLGVLVEESSLTSIATRLSLSRNTVKTHLRSVYRALDADSRDQALVNAARAGLVSWAEGDTIRSR